MNNIYNRYIWLLHTVYQERKVTFERLCDIWKHHFLYNVHIPEHTRSLSGSLLGYKTIP